MHFMDPTSSYRNELYSKWVTNGTEQNGHAMHCDVLTKETVE